MKALYLFSLIAFLAVAVFGFSGFSANHDTGFMACANFVNNQSAGCSANNFQMAISHVQTYLSFTLGILLVFFLIIGLLFTALVIKTEFVRVANYSFQTFQEQISQLKLQQFWFAYQQKVI